MADDLLVQWKKFYDAPDADKQAVMAETQDRFVRQSWESRRFLSTIWRTARWTLKSASKIARSD